MKKTFKFFIMLVILLLTTACSKNEPKPFVKSSKIEAEIINKNFFYGQLVSTDHYVVVSTKDKQEGDSVPKKYIKMRILSQSYGKTDALKEQQNGLEINLLKDVIKSIKNSQADGIIEYIYQPAGQEVRVIYSNYPNKSSSLRMDVDGYSAITYTGKEEELQQILEIIEKLE